MDKDLLRFAKDKQFCFTDLETCNLNLSYYYNRPWQCGIIITKGEKILEEHDLHIKLPPHLNVGAGAAKVTKFNYADYLSKARDENEVFDLIYKKFNESDYIIGHNLLGFDVYLFNEWYKQNKKDFRPILNKIIDTYFLYKGNKINIIYNRNTDSLLEYMYKILHKKAKGIKGNLAYIAKEYSIDFDPELLHNAMYDLKLNMDIWNKLKFNVEV